jgi:hypothetical protein
MTEQTAVERLINRLYQTLHTIFNPRRSYFADIYQRENEWKPKNVRKRPKRAAMEGQLLVQEEGVKLS